MTNLIPLSSAVVTLDTVGAKTQPLSRRIVDQIAEMRAASVEPVRTCATTAVKNWLGGLEKSLATADAQFYKSSQWGLRNQHNSGDFDFREGSRSVGAISVVQLTLPQLRPSDLQWALDLALETARPELERDGFDVLGVGIQGGVYMIVVGSPDLSDARKAGLA